MGKDRIHVSRRKFLIGTAAAAITSPFVKSASARSVDRLRHAGIGVGGMGAGDLKQLVSHGRVDIIALCDVDENNLKRAAELYPNARCYADWRELLTKEGGNIDSVNVSVPDHNHFVIAHAAIQAGKHVYCQKPMCHDVAEVRELTRAAQKAKVVTQLGTQHAGSSGDRTAVEWLKRGLIGKVRHVYLCSNRPGAIDRYRLVGPRPQGEQIPPSTLNWDLWIGTAPYRPYHPEIYHPVTWRAWQDFGTGWSGDIGCHIFDAVWKGLELQSPKSVIAEVQKSWEESAARRGDTWPQSDHITWVFPGNRMTEGKELPVEWFDGLMYPPEEIRALYSGGEYPAESAMVVGTKGALLIPHGGTPVLLPENNFTNVQEPTIPARNHYHHFVDACLGGERTESRFEVSGPMTEAILLGTVAIRVPGVELKWDAKRMRFPNYPEADRYIKRTYREGWRVAGLF